jgi:hypothetical protein
MQFPSERRIVLAAFRSCAERTSFQFEDGRWRRGGVLLSIAAANNTRYVSLLMLLISSDFTSGSSGADIKV